MASQLQDQFCPIFIELFFHQLQNLTLALGHGLQKLLLLPPDSHSFLVESLNFAGMFFLIEYFHRVDDDEIISRDVVI